MIRAAAPARTLDALVARHGDVPVLPVSFAQMRFYVLDQSAATADSVSVRGAT